ncbi:MAG: hypothetical protein AAGF90_00640 [Pseudomonadota bacterium]
MKIAARMVRLAAARPAEALNDALGLAAVCVLLFVGFAATSIA